MQPAPAEDTFQRSGAIFLDARHGGRALRVTWHHEAGLVVLSLWRGGTCAGTFRLAVDEVPDLIAILRAGLDASYDGVRAVPDGSADTPIGSDSEV